AAPSPRRAHPGHDLPAAAARRAALEPETLVRGTVAHADPESEPAARQLVDDGRGLRVVEGMARVDVGDAGAERDLARGERERLTERQTVTRARAVESGEPFTLEPLG